MRGRYFALCLWTSLTLAGQTRPDMQAVIERLDRLEEQNRQLTAEIRSLRQQLAAAPNTVTPGPAEPVQPSTPQDESTIQERRIEELDQSKVGTDQRLPVNLTGTVLFNAFLNGQSSGGRMNPTTASLTP